MFELKTTVQNKQRGIQSADFCSSWLVSELEEGGVSVMNPGLFIQILLWRLLDRLVGNDETCLISPHRMEAVWPLM